MSVVSVLHLPVRGDAVDELARSFVELDVFGHSRRSGGFRRGCLLRPLEAGADSVVIAEWETADDYQGWLDNPVRAELNARIAPLLAGEVVAGALYEEVPVS